MAAAGVGPEEAASNLARWASAMGLPDAAKWLADSPADIWGMVIGASVLSFSVAMVICSYRAAKFTAPKDTELPKQSRTTQVDEQEPTHDTPIYKAIDHIAAEIGDRDENECLPMARRALREAALNGRLQIWGRKSDSVGGNRWNQMITPIPKEYWEKAQIGALATSYEEMYVSGEFPHTGSQQYPDGQYGERVHTYAQCRVSFNQILKCWPKTESKLHGPG